MIKTIEKLGVLAESISNFNNVNLDVYECAHIVNLVGGDVDKAIEWFNSENFNYGTASEVIVVSGDKFNSFDIANKIFHWAVTEICGLCHHKGVNINGGLLEKKLHHAFRCSDNFNMSINNALTVVLIEYASLFNINITASVGEYRHNTYIVMMAEC